MAPNDGMGVPEPNRGLSTWQWVLATGLPALALVGLVALFMIRRNRNAKSNLKSNYDVLSRASSTSQPPPKRNIAAVDATSANAESGEVIPPPTSHQGAISSMEAILIANSFKLALQKSAHAEDEDDDQDIHTMISNLGMRPVTEDYPPDHSFERRDEDGEEVGLDSFSNNTSPRASLASIAMQEDGLIAPAQVALSPSSSSSAHLTVTRVSMDHRDRESHLLTRGMMKAVRGGPCVAVQRNPTTPRVVSQAPTSLPEHPVPSSSLNS
jgi:hypothetical protein